MSRAVIVRAFGSPDYHALESRDPRRPGPGEVRIAVRAAGVSFVDALVAAGSYQYKPPLPFVPGSELSGVIEAVGEGVSEARIGQRVCVAAFDVAFAEVAVVSESLALPIPDEMTFEEAAIFQASYMTAYYALVQRGSLKSGETLCVLGAGGAVGHAAVQIGKALGATVIASASTGEKRAYALAGGADRAIDSGSPDWRADLTTACDGHGPDVILDPVGGASMETAFGSLEWGGRHLVVGFTAGDIPRIPASLILRKGAALIGVEARQMTSRDPAIFRTNIQALFALYRAGHITPFVASRYPLERFADALNEAKAGRGAGRVIIVMN